MATIESDIEAALFARVAALVLSPVLPVAFPNIDFVKPASYLRVNHIPNLNRRLFIGSADPHQRLGLLQLTAFAPLDKGAAPATEIAGQVAEWFPTDIRLTSGAASVRVTRAPDIAQALRDDPHWMVPVTVEYECFA